LLLNRAASVAILPFALLVSDFSLGARWVFSFQWVLLPVYRPLLSFLERSWARTLSQSPGLGGHARLSGKTRQAATPIARWVFRSGSYTSPLTHK
jgi:hypothetical protein